MELKKINLEKEFAKKGLELFKQYLWVIYCVSYETFKNWNKADQEDALKDFFNK
jgi:hypothetical protein